MNIDFSVIQAIGNIYLSGACFHFPMITLWGYEYNCYSLILSNKPSLFFSWSCKANTPVFTSLQNFEVALKQMSQTADTMEIVQSIMTENCSAALTPAARDIYNNQVVSGKAGSRSFYLRCAPCATGFKGRGLRLSWASWRLRLPAIRVFVQQFVETYIK